MKIGGTSIWTDPETGTFERDGVSCAHCNRWLYLKPRGAPTAEHVLGDLAKVAPVHDKFDAANGGWCGVCAATICGPCVATGKCTPLEKRLAEEERRAALLKSLL